MFYDRLLGTVLYIMDSLELKAKCVGDGITAISECQKVAKSYGKNIFLEFREGFSIVVRPTSETQDLVQIWMLEKKAHESKAVS
jgi:hypothetical protein